ncbi:MAG: nucleolar RNA-binding Nop10p family protein, partial [Candidatus Heimdallarchaeaceae archaeon]
TLDSEHCPSCGGNVVSPHPPRFSLEKERKYSKYRRELVKQQIRKISSN